MRIAHLGKKHSIETKQKISKTHLGKLNPNYGKHPSEETLRKLFRANQIKPNKQELKLQEILNRYFPNTWKFVGDGQLVIGGKCPDFTNINAKKSLIEFFGDHWHADGMIERWTRTELGRIMCYNSYGYKCLVIWEHELRNEEAVVEKIKQWQNLKSSSRNTVRPASN